MLVQGSHHRVRRILPRPTEEQEPSGLLPRPHVIRVRSPGSRITGRCGTFVTGHRRFAPRARSAVAQRRWAADFQSSQQTLHQLASPLRISLNFMEIALGSAVGRQLPFHHLRIQQHAGQHIIQPVQYLGAIVVPVTLEQPATVWPVKLLSPSRGEVRPTHQVFVAIRILKCIHDLSLALEVCQLVHTLLKQERCQTGSRPNKPCLFNALAEAADVRSHGT